MCLYSKQTNKAEAAEADKQYQEQSKKKQKKQKQLKKKQKKKQQKNERGREFSLQYVTNEQDQSVVIVTIALPMKRRKK
jgi:hypothetical protein